MKEAAQFPYLARFDSFEVNLRSGELCKNGERIRLPEQSFQILAMLLERPGEVITRQEIQQRLWPNDTVVEFETGINGIIRRLRAALGDSAEEPKYVETLSRHGYRWKASVVWTEPLPREAQAPAPPRVSAPIDSPASHLIGKKVSHYRVLEVLGGGGMGVVYKAEDLTLGRPVAMKFLPEELGDDSKARERFEHEARAVSALSHPNVCPIYEFAEYEGQPFIVMELLHGKTLREHLADGAFRLTDPARLDIAVQIASGLEAAHEKGIIHRDIKPANIFVTEKNVAKILDFGVAKMFEAGEAQELAAAASREGISSKPVAANLTRTGLKLGTAGYMSPEQIRGEPLDVRTDIFSFGVVLYEMATGEPAFRGETERIQQEAALTDNTLPVRELTPEISPKLEVVITKCLEKAREQRYRNASELYQALVEVEHCESTPRHEKRRSKATTRWLFSSLIAIAFALGITSGVKYWWKHRPLATTAFHKYNIKPLTTTGNLRWLDLSREGRYLAYAAQESGQYSLWIQQIATSSNVRLVGPLAPEIALEEVHFSANGDYIYYTQLDHRLGRWSDMYRVPAVGGNSSKVFTVESASSALDAYQVHTFAPSPDGSRLAFTRSILKTAGLETDLILADSDGKNEHRTITVTSPKRIVQLAWSPDRRSIAVAIDEEERAFAQSLAIVSAESGSQLRIFHNINFYQFRWLPDGSGIVLCGSRPQDDVDQLWILALPEGSLRKITSDLNTYRQLAVSADGRNLATSYKQLDSSIWIAPIDRPSDAKQIVINAGRMDGFGGLTWLPGNRLLFVGSEPQKQIWCMDFDGNHRQQLTYLKDDALDPSVTKDGSNILFTFENGVWRMGVDGSEPRQIVETKMSRSLAAISPDGAWFVYEDTAGLLRRSILGGDPTLIDPVGGLSQFGSTASPLPAVSRDGRKIAFQHWGDDKNLQLGVVAADSTGPPRFLPFLPTTEEQVPTMGNQPIQWTPSGDAITYVRTIGGVSNLWSQPVTGGPPKQITRFTSGYIWRHAWSMDGKYLALARGTFSKDAVLFSDLR